MFFFNPWKKVVYDVKEGMVLGLIFLVEGRQVLCIFFGAGGKMAIAKDYFFWFYWRLGTRICQRNPSTEKNRLYQREVFGKFQFFSSARYDSDFFYFLHYPLYF